MLVTLPIGPLSVTGPVGRVGMQALWQGASGLCQQGEWPVVMAGKVRKLWRREALEGETKHKASEVKEEKNSPQKGWEVSRRKLDE